MDTTPTPSADGPGRFLAWRQSNHTTWHGSHYESDRAIAGRSRAGRIGSAGMWAQRYMQQAKPVLIARMWAELKTSAEPRKRRRIPMSLDDALAPGPYELQVSSRRAAGRRYRIERIARSLVPFDQPTEPQDAVWDLEHSTLEAAVRTEDQADLVVVEGADLPVGEDSLLDPEEGAE